MPDTGRFPQEIVEPDTGPAGGGGDANGFHTAVFRKQHTTTQGNARIDFVYCTQPLYERIVDAYVVRDDYTSTNARLDEATNFYFPSDHLPILVDFEIE